MWSRICIPDISFSISGMTIIHEVTFSGCKWWEIEPRTRMVCLKLGFSKIMAYIYNWYIILKPSPRMFGGSKIKKKTTYSKLLSSCQLEGAMSTFFFGRQTVPDFTSSSDQTRIFP
jgi:hypothetical protein